MISDQSTKAPRRGLIQTSAFLVKHNSHLQK
jgi:hypothetical protein